MSLSTFSHVEIEVPTGHACEMQTLEKSIKSEKRAQEQRY